MNRFKVLVLLPVCTLLIEREPPKELRDLDQPLA